MPENNGTPDPAEVRKSNATTSPEKPALEIALAQIEILRGDLRHTVAGVNKPADALKAAQRESKTSEEKIQFVRQTVRSLQSVRI